MCAGGQAGRRVSRRGENQVGQADGHQLVCQCQRINQQLRRAAREGKGIGKGLGRGSANWVHHGHAERARRSKLVPSNISINSQQQQHSQQPTANSENERTNEWLLTGRREVDKAVRVHNSHIEHALRQWMLQSGVTFDDLRCLPVLSCLSCLPVSACLPV